MKPVALAAKTRVWSIDVLRGIVMVIMALDHVRDYFHVGGMTADPTDLATTTPWLFFTRWVTHFCAPVFVFLSGTSAYLLGKKISKTELSLFLVKRGGWLVVVEIVIVTFAWTFDPSFNSIFLQVIWAIGVSMIMLGLLVQLPFPLIFVTGLLIVLGHNLLDYPEAAQGGKVGFWWNLLHHAKFSAYAFMEGHFVIIIYAFVPWTGVMTLGYCMGRLYAEDVDPAYRRKIFFYIGTGLIALFIILRAINGYGDPAPWSFQRNSVYTFLSFLNVTKYPPSLMYLCIMIGPAILFLAFFERVQNKFTRMMNLFGRVPFFYYVFHLYLIHILCVIVFFLSGYSEKDIASSQSPFLFRPADFGFSLPGVYVVWLLVIIILYPACRWYNQYKRTHHQWWLSYL